MALLQIIARMLIKHLDPFSVSLCGGKTLVERSNVASLHLEMLTWPATGHGAWPERRLLNKPGLHPVAYSAVQADGQTARPIAYLRGRVTEPEQRCNRSRKHSWLQRQHQQSSAETSQVESTFPFVDPFIDFRI